MTIFNLIEGNSLVQNDYLCFTANINTQSVKLNVSGTPNPITLETSTDGDTWSSYTIGDTITLTNAGDKVYFRNTSSDNVAFNKSTGDYYRFSLGNVSASGNVNYLLNKFARVDILGSYCFYGLFRYCRLTTPPRLPATKLGNFCYGSMFTNCTSLTTVPELPATGLKDSCYQYMFDGCTSLEALPKLSATYLPSYCYQNMFRGCSKIKISKTQTGNYVNKYRIPIVGTGTVAYNGCYNMFSSTGGTFTGTPTLNTNYYTSNNVI